ncbi:MAG: glycosyltransferase family 2 protein [Sporocytophaga sp.]|uniref:glycosyltransferase family 2 protein n=1 Tax=Sporocytophaga sp. TaxID=2231183 RepID=UPI001B253E55|nr:glycosyltransferase family 2 protein [Sporocytophaga sp.]MBO9701644.1 glycosyltransferase family 2 protein [Sporocytophaga sp.]
MILFSIVICSYNPDARLLEKCVNACLNQLASDVEYEIILVDNNSTESLKKNLVVKNFLEKDQRFKVIEEKRQGLIYARIAGFNESKGSFIIFADDDNVLALDYIQNLKVISKNIPWVGIWGAGDIEVNFIDGVPTWIEKYFQDMFQYRKLKYLQYGCVKGWPDYYPVGSGISVRKDIFEEYLKRFELGMVTAIGRSKDSLSSAEDSQIVWAAMLSGIASGTSPDLRLTHIIPKKRTSRKYLTDLNFNISRSYYKALFEMFPGEIKSYAQHTISFRLGFVLKQLIKAGFKPLLFYRFFTIRNSWNKGLRETLAK